jgi:cytoskeletal protein CcmA (bactofilin family)
MAQDVVDQHAAGQDIILYPTIHSKAAGGNWNSSSTWEEGRVPNSTDVVEINGNVMVNGDFTVNGLLVNEGKILEGYNWYTAEDTLTVNGNLINHGTIRYKNGNSSYPLYVYAAGQVQNNGYFASLSLDEGAEWLPGTNAIQNVAFIGDATVKSGATGITETGYMRVDSGATATLEEGVTLKNTGYLLHTGTIAGDGTLEINTTTYQYMEGVGTIGPDEVIFSGTAKRGVKGTQTIASNVTVNSGAILEGYNAATTDLYIDGDLTNNGELRYKNNSGTYPLYVYSNGQVVNNGYMEAMHFQTGSEWLPGTSPMVAMAFVGNATVKTGTGITESGYIRVDSGATATIESGATLKNTATFINNGDVEGDGILNFSGTSAQTVEGAGTISPAQVLFSGAGIKSIKGNQTFDSNVEIATGATVKNHSAATYQMTVKGVFTNSGTTANYSGTKKLIVTLYDDLDNNYQMNHSQTFAIWPSQGAGVTYQLQITANGPGAWGTEISTGTNNYYEITAYESEVRDWRWRTSTGGSYGEWSEAKDIN